MNGSNDRTTDLEQQVRELTAEIEYLRTEAKRDRIGDSLMRNIEQERRDFHAGIFPGISGWRWREKQGPASATPATPATCPPRSPAAAPAPRRSP